MGPRFVNRGCDERPGMKQQAAAELQWGRGLLTADASEQMFIGIIWTRLQWGRGLLTADAAVADSPSDRKYWLQWGRGLLTADARNTLPI